ncbi:hypothetical protein Hanom_Chr10g00895151 [Helianthus anomalus]
MALGDLMESRFSVSNHLDRYSNSHRLDVNSTNSTNSTVVVVQDVVVHDNRDSNNNHRVDSGVQSRENDRNVDREDSETVASSSGYGNAVVSGIPATSMAYLPQNVVLTELRHESFEAGAPSGPVDSGLVSKWRPKDRGDLESCLFVTYMLLVLDIRQKCYHFGS